LTDIILNLLLSEVSNYLQIGVALKGSSTMARKCCQPECYATCLPQHQALLLHLNTMILQSQTSKQDFLGYLLGMAVSEAQGIVDCAHQEAWLQKGIRPETELVLPD
jgi:hypothetical protein